MTNTREPALEAAASRDRLLVLAGLIAISALAWGYTISLADGMAEMDIRSAALAQTHPWTPTDLAMAYAMWVVMMVAMMAPTAAPMLLTLARIDRAQRSSAAPLAPAAAFLLGYLIVWSGFSLLAVLAQWRLHQAAWVSAAGASNGAVFGGLLLLGAGVFQFTPLKQACLTHCRSPLAFLLTRWRPGARGGLRMGIVHGGYCVGCCWALMALMFFAGTMNLLWIAGLALLMLAEKALPPGRWVGRLAGVGLASWGAALLAAGVVSG